MLEALVGLLPSVGRFFKDFSRRRRLQDERGQLAVESILRAASETKLYIAALARNNNQDSDREADLARHWVAAAAALHGIDDDLALRCRLKGEYWTDPANWDEKQLEKARILLTQVVADADVLLGWGRGGAKRTKDPSKAKTTKEELRLPNDGKL